MADTRHVDQVERERPRAGSVGSCSPVTLGQAQEFLGLSQPAPRELPFKQLVDERPDGGAEVRAFAR